MKGKIKTSRHLNSLRSRYGILIAALIVFVLLFSVVQFLIMDDIYTYRTKRNLIEASQHIESLNNCEENFYKEITECEAYYNIYVEIYHPKDVLIYTTGDNNWIYDPSITESDADTLSPRIMKILGHKDVDNSSYFETRQEYYASAKYIVYGKTYDDFAMEIYYSVDVITANAKTASWSLFVLMLIILCLIIAATVIYVQTFILPIEEINRVTKRITEMDFSRTCPNYKTKELGELSSSVNALSSSFDLTLKDLRTKNRRLQHEIEKEHQLEEVRKQFIANASHELKTPISIIQGYAEGLKYGITDGSPEEYCDIIIDETEKMNTLVMRLLEITKYDYGGYTVHWSVFNIKDVIDKIMSSRLRMLKENGIEFICDIDENLNAYGDTDIVSQVFGNYLSNAVSHCEFQKTITVFCREAEDAYRISVKNTGKPIADDDIDNIWQSFYRADKAHSRTEGRFGLGLSIVVSLQNAVGQKYGVINHNDGAEFWFDISKVNK